MIKLFRKLLSFRGECLLQKKRNDEQTAVIYRYLEEFRQINLRLVDITKEVLKLHRSMGTVDQVLYEVKSIVSSMQFEMMLYQAPVYDEKKDEVDEDE